MDTGAMSWSPITTSHLLGRNKWAPPDMAGARCAHKNPKFCESSLKGLWTFPKQTLTTFWFCYESRWNRVVLTEFFLEVWFGSHKSKAKLKDWKAKRAKNLCCLTLSETKAEGPTKPRGTATMSSSRAHALDRHQTVSLEEFHPPN